MVVTNAAASERMNPAADAILGIDVKLGIEPSGTLVGIPFCRRPR
jgi:hypothetical protein